MNGAVQISHATLAAPGHVNEDLAASGPDWVAVLDGATPMRGVPTGCRHDVPWLVRGLAAALGQRLTRSAAADTAGGPDALAGLVAEAIDEVRGAHAGTCDLANPDSPSSTLAVVRIRERHLDYLVLCDSPVLLRRRDGSLTLLADSRLTAIPRPRTAAMVAALRNQPGGFWVASTDPGAAWQTVRGSVPLADVREAALFSDGVTRLTEWYRYPWAALLDRLQASGPAGLIATVRAAERAYPHPRGKQHDDATAAHLRWGAPE